MIVGDDPRWVANMETTRCRESFFTAGKWFQIKQVKTGVMGLWHYGDDHKNCPPLIPFSVKFDNGDANYLFYDLFAATLRQMVVFWMKSQGISEDSVRGMTHLPHMTWFGPTSSPIVANDSPIITEIETKLIKTKAIAKEFNDYMQNMDKDGILPLA